MKIEIGDRVTFIAKFKGLKRDTYTMIITNNSDLYEVSNNNKIGAYRVLKIERPVYETKFSWKDLSEEEKEELSEEWNRRASETQIKRLQEEKNKSWLEKLFDW